MAARKGGTSHGISDDAAERIKIRAGLPDPEKTEFDKIVDKIDNGMKPNRHERKQIRKWQGQGKLKILSKSFKSPSDKKTHQNP